MSGAGVGCSCMCRRMPGAICRMPVAGAGCRCYSCRVPVPGAGVPVAAWMPVPDADTGCRCRVPDARCRMPVPVVPDAGGPVPVAGLPVPDAGAGCRMPVPDTGGRWPENKKCILCNSQSHAFRSGTWASPVATSPKKKMPQGFRPRPCKKLRVRADPLVHLVDHLVPLSPLSVAAPKVPQPAPAVPNTWVGMREDPQSVIPSTYCGPSVKSPRAFLPTLVFT